MSFPISIWRPANQNCAFEGSMTSLEAWVPVRSSVFVNSMRMVSWGGNCMGYTMVTAPRRRFNASSMIFRVRVFEDLARRRSTMALASVMAPARTFCIASVGCCPFRRRSGSLLIVKPPDGIHLSAQTSLSLSSSLCSSFRPIISPGTMVPCSASSSISMQTR
ncbi:uncharacterized protein LOC120321622 [Drosophila yakuba]|uniref:uncharacterized protein LOC120321622 n=1 Tax=Drosophila yakuba TaxID=7245 RepID=UPI0019307C38|nr:uncharacterized protein LOC120321622 [Drosophila yakuba]